MEKKVTKFGTGAHIIVDKEFIGKTMNVELKEAADGGQLNDSQPSECEAQAKQN